MSTLTGGSGALAAEASQIDSLAFAGSSFGRGHRPRRQCHLPGRLRRLRYGMAPVRPRLRLTSLAVRTDDDNYTGRGATQDNGRLVVLLTSGAGELRMSGPLAKVRVEEGGR